MGALLADNLVWRSHAKFDLLGRPLGDLACEARREVLRQADSYVKSYAPEGPAGGDCRGPLIVTGHQPGLAHPGVWIKNFAAAALAERHGGTAIHVVIDADACRTPAILVPSGSVEAPRLVAVEFDRLAPAMPWEEREVLDNELWSSFPERVDSACQKLAPTPYLRQWWPLAESRASATGRLGAGLAQARHQAEIGWGRRNAELPQSLLCQTAAFRWFVCTLLVDLPRFAAAYNDALDEYRRRHRLRNHAQPIPNLSRDGDWLEAPFWLWSAADPQRRPVFARRTSNGVLISDRGALELALPLTGPRNTEQAIARLAEWEASGAKLRSRALTTTMFTRLLVADVFLHGIGGAKYDEATDAICERFFGAPPPAFAVLSGTLRLPIDRPRADWPDPRRLRTDLRELAYHPERHVELAAIPARDRPQAEAEIAEKARWIRTPKTPANAARRHRAIAAANAALQPAVAPIRAKIEGELAAAVDQSRANRVLDSREYAFCLFPRACLEKFLLDFAGEAL
jgi:hypothetical protein